jgi:hypothetical protein
VNEIKALQPAIADVCEVGKIKSQRDTPLKSTPSKLLPDCQACVAAPDQTRSFPAHVSKKGGKNGHLVKNREASCLTRFEHSFSLLPSNALVTSATEGAPPFPF